MSRVLLLSEEEARTILYCAHKGGHEVVVAGPLSGNKDLRFHPMCSKFVPMANALDFQQCTEALVEEIESIIEEEAIEVLLPTSFDCIRIVSRFRDRLSERVSLVPTPNLETIATLDDKYEFFEFCRRSGLAHPDSWLLDDVDKLRDQAFVESLPYPIIGKPVLGAGGEGLEIFQNEEELKSYYLDRPPTERHALPILLQDYFEGVDVDFNGFAVDGDLCVGSVMRTRFYEQGPDFSITDYVDDDAVYALGAGIVKEARYSGPLNIDMRTRADDGTVQLIEVNPRFWARVITSLIDEVNFIDVAIRAADDPGYRLTSGRTGRQWTQDIIGPLLAMIRHRDPLSIEAVRGISALQVRYALFANYYAVLARVRNYLER